MTDPLCDLAIHEDGRIEDNEDMVEIDFANKYIGGGVLNAGCVQVPRLPSSSPP